MVPGFLKEVAAPFPLGWAVSVKSLAKSDLIDPAGEGGQRQDKFECPPSIYLNFGCNKDDCKVVPPASKPKHLTNTNGRGAESLLHTELVQGIRRKFLSASMFGITSDPVSYSQAIISSQLSQHLFCVSCLLGDSHLRYPLEQPEGSSLPGCSASPLSPPTSGHFPSCQHPLRRVLRLHAQLGHRAAARPLGYPLSLLMRFPCFQKHCKTWKRDFQPGFLGLVPRTWCIKETEQGVYENDNYFCSVMSI